MTNKITEDTLIYLTLNEDPINTLEIVKAKDITNSFSVYLMVGNNKEIFDSKYDDNFHEKFVNFMRYINYCNSNILLDYTTDKEQVISDIKNKIEHGYKLIKELEQKGLFDE